jgi:hypothetical protein
MQGDALSKVSQCSCIWQGQFYTTIPIPVLYCQKSAPWHQRKQSKNSLYNRQDSVSCHLFWKYVGKFPIRTILLHFYSPFNIKNQFIFYVMAVANAKISILEELESKSSNHCNAGMHLAYSCSKRSSNNQMIKRREASQRLQQGMLQDHSEIQQNYILILQAQPLKPKDAIIRMPQLHI